MLLALYSASVSLRQPLDALCTCVPAMRHTTLFHTFAMLTLAVLCYLEGQLHAACSLQCCHGRCHIIEGCILPVHRTADEEVLTLGLLLCSHLVHVHVSVWHSKAQLVRGDLPSVRGGHGHQCHLLAVHHYGPCGLRPARLCLAPAAHVSLLQLNLNCLVGLLLCQPPVCFVCCQPHIQ